MLFLNNHLTGMQEAIKLTEIYFITQLQRKKRWIFFQLIWLLRYKNVFRNLLPADSLTVLKNLMLTNGFSPKELTPKKDIWIYESKFLEFIQTQYHLWKGAYLAYASPNFTKMGKTVFFILR